MCSCENGDAPDFSTSTVTRARKPHRCCECRRVIAVGHLYERRTYKWEGTIFTDKMCAACARLGRAFSSVDPECGGWEVGSLLECVRELIRNEPASIERDVVAAFLCRREAA